MAEYRDDLPPTTVITYVGQVRGGKRLVRGVTADNGVVKEVTVISGVLAKAMVPNFAQWEAEIPAAGKISALSTDAAGNVEQRPHSDQWGLSGLGVVPRVFFLAFCSFGVTPLPFRIGLSGD